jgi:hypothetical protein
MRTHIFTAILLLDVPLAACCGSAGAETADTDGAPPFAVIGVAGNCPADAGPMRPAPAGSIADLNGDGYVCTPRVSSMASDSLRLTVDNDAAPAEGAPLEPDTYSGM